MLAVPTQPVRNRTAFLDAVNRSGLLNAKQFVRATSGLAETDTCADTAAEQFVKLGLLTPFQVKRLLSGKSDGFILGPYIILEPLGEGRRGKVYRARHRTMNRIVAIKLLTPDRTRPADFRDAFESATKTAVQLLHPNIVTTYDANRCGEALYAVLEYVPGENLHSLVRTAAPLPVELACDCARQVALALQHAHERGTVHGLLNPDNVVIGRAESPAVKVLNFGYGQLAALYANDATSQLDGAMAATDYFAPELFDPKNAATPASDLFSLGCILHYLLAGRPPSGDGSIHQLSNRHGVERWRPGLSSELAQLVRDLLEQNPNERSASAGEVAVRLAAFGPGLGNVELAMPAVSPTDVAKDSPFADFDSRDESREVVPSPRRSTRREARIWSEYGAYLLAALVILATGSAIAVVLRSVVR